VVWTKFLNIIQVEFRLHDGGPSLMRGQSVWGWCWTRCYWDSLVSDWRPSDKAMLLWISQSTGQKNTFAFSLQRVKSLWILKTTLSIWQSSIYFAVTSCCVHSDDWIPLLLLPVWVYPIVWCHLGILISMQVSKHLRGTVKLFHAVMLLICISGEPLCSWDMNYPDILTLLLSSSMQMLV